MGPERVQAVPPQTGWPTLSAADPALLGLTGQGISVAVIDSGYHPGHPHLGPIAGGVAFGADGEPRDDLVDRLGHGTAVTAAIQEKAPGVELWVVKVFDDRLATSVPALVRALDWAVERGTRLINLSLGTPHAFRAERLAPAVRRAVERGCLLVSACAHEGRPWLPGSLPGALGVVLDWDCPRDAIRLERGPDGPRVRASGYPRPIPGVPVEHNLKGISFAVANATGLLARALEGAPPDPSLEAALARAFPTAPAGEPEA